MKKSELILERKHAKYMVDFFKIHRLGSYKASETYQRWLRRYDEIKKQIKKLSKLKTRNK